MDMTNTTSVFDSKPFVRSKRFYIIKNAFEYFTALTVAEPFLTYLLTDLGMSDSSIGIISSIISFAFLFQLISITIVSRIRNRKLFSIVSHAVGQFSFAALFLVPVLGLPRMFSVIFILGGYFGNYLVSTMVYRWGLSFVNPNNRGRFGAVNEMVSLIGGMAVQLGSAFIFERFQNAGNTNRCYLFFTIMLSCFGTIDIVCLSMMKKEKDNDGTCSSSQSVISVLRILFGSRDFRRILFLGCVWSIAIYSSKGFVGTYMLKELGVSVALVQIIKGLSSFFRFLLAFPIGAFSDRKSYREGMNSSCFLALLSILCLALTTPRMSFFVIAYSILFNISQAGTESNLTYQLYESVDESFISQAMAIKNALCGLIGFGSSVLCSFILSAIQSHSGFRLFTFNLYGQQVLACISCILVICCMFLNRRRN